VRTAPTVILVSLALASPTLILTLVQVVDGYQAWTLPPLVVSLLAFATSIVALALTLNWSLASPAAIQGRDFSDALSASVRLLNGNRWLAFWLFVVVGMTGLLVLPVVWAHMGSGAEASTVYSDYSPIETAYVSGVNSVTSVLSGLLLAHLFLVLRRARGGAATAQVFE
jgi:hypothetical protein